MTKMRDAYDKHLIEIEEKCYRYGIDCQKDSADLMMFLNDVKKLIDSYEGMALLKHLGDDLDKSIQEYDNFIGELPYRLPKDFYEKQKELRANLILNARTVNTFIKKIIEGDIDQ